MHSPPGDHLAVLRTAEEIAALRARAIADANQLRALAFVALRDGMPMAELRSSNARSAARSILKSVRQLSRDRIATSAGRTPPAHQAQASEGAPQDALEPA
ncbi:hypothetical protein [Methylobacterium nodulans]|uniref:hypothetical protein n=1 Tax=Methylobacterium nodulans TaxID=114616 RepID=UPI000681F72B|nr:hypothetical protein [Methylobacterium nodulans]